jgi:hypothetical protein
MNWSRIKRDFCLIAAGFLGGGVLAHFNGPPHDWLITLVGFMVMFSIAAILTNPEEREE